MTATEPMGHTWYSKAISGAQLGRALLHYTLTLPLPPSQHPSEEKINGILLGFRIRYRELLYDRLRGYSLHTINSMSTWGELTGEALHDKSPSFTTCRCCFRAQIHFHLAVGMLHLLYVGDSILGREVLLLCFTHETISHG